MVGPVVAVERRGSAVEFQVAPAAVLGVRLQFDLRAEDEDAVLGDAVGDRAERDAEVPADRAVEGVFDAPGPVLDADDLARVAAEGNGLVLGGVEGAEHHRAGGERALAAEVHVEGRGLVGRRREDRGRHSFAAVACRERADCCFGGIGVDARGSYRRTWRRGWRFRKRRAWGAASSGRTARSSGLVQITGSAASTIMSVLAVPSGISVSGQPCSLPGRGSNTVPGPAKTR